jgi:hypothetical protein
MSENPTTYLTIMSKNNIFSFLGLMGVEMVDTDEIVKPVSAVVKLDPREGQPILKEYQTRGEAIRHYEDAVTTSVSRGWRIIYRGQPLWG